MNRYVLIASAVMIATAPCLFAQIPTDQDIKNGVERIVGTKTANERKAYKEARKEVKQIEKQEKKQEKTTQEACTPTVRKQVKSLVSDPYEAARDLSNNRKIGSSQCDRENEKLEALKTKEAEAERVAQEKKEAYEKAKKETKSWR